MLEGSMSYEEEQEKLHQLALLCLEKHEKLTDEELESIANVGGDLRDFFDRCQRFALCGARQLQRYRLRRRQLEQLSTEELELESRKMHEERNRFLARVDEDELPDSFFGAPPIDSDENILYELLRERRKAGTSKSVTL